MCRQRQLHGWMAVAFGVGILTGSTIESGLWAFLAAVGAICLGVCWLTRGKY
jgi:hypothetical protein